MLTIAQHFILSISLVATWSLWTGPISLAEDNPSQMPLQASAKYEELLPTSFKGRWLRTRHILKTNEPLRFCRLESGLWDIRQVGNVVVLKNTATGTQAMATLTGLSGNQATLTVNSSPAQHRRCTETLTLIAVNDQLTGSQQKQCFVDGLPKPYFYAEANVTGKRAALP